MSYCEHCGSKISDDSDDIKIRLHELEETVNRLRPEMTPSLATRLVQRVDQLEQRVKIIDDLEHRLGEFSKTPRLHRVATLEDKVELYRKAADSMVRRVIALEAKVARLRKRKGSV